MPDRPPPFADAANPFIGVSLGFRRLLAQLHRVAGLRHPVLLRGETGTGKELAARFLHHRGPAPSGPFVAVNCAAIPEPLAESHLFGHVRGSFTGAHRNHTGAFVRAHQGTLFLDEVAELSLLLQAKLLRVLETQRVVPVGAEEESAVRVRVVAATHRDLEGMVQNGSLREDLYHRLGVLPVHVPALRERRDDIPLLIEQFREQAEQELGRSAALTEDALRLARAHPWPGNIRALRNAIFRAAAFVDGELDGPGLAALIDPPTVGRNSGADAIAVPRGTYGSMRKALLEQVVAEQGSIRRAARSLGLPRSTLWTWLRQSSRAPTMDPGSAGVRVHDEAPRETRSGKCFEHQTGADDRSPTDNRRS